MMKKTILLALLIVVALPNVYAQLSFCLNPFVDLATAQVSLAPVNVTPSTSNGAAIASTSTPGSATPPTAAFGSPNCHSFVSRQIRWENLVNNTGPSDEIIVNTPLETLAVVNTDDVDASIAEIRWYDQEGLVPTGLPAPELRVDHTQNLLGVAHTAVSDGVNRGDMMLATIDTNDDLHVGRYRATNVSPTVCQSSFIDSVSSNTLLLDYNNGRLAILTKDASDLVVYTINTNTCALINRVAINGGSVGGEFGTGIRMDAAGDIYLSWTQTTPTQYHVLKLSGAAISWDKILSTAGQSASAPDNLIALQGTNVYAGANLVDGNRVVRLSQALGAADYQLNIGGVGIVLNGITTRTLISPGVYYYGRETGSLQGAFGSVTETAGVPAHFCAGRYPDFAPAGGFSGNVHTVADGNFFRVFLGGERWQGGVQDSMGLLVRHDCIVETGLLNGFFLGARVDIAGTGNTDFFQDSVLRPTAGFFDFFTAVGNGVTLAAQIVFPQACGDGALDPPFETCDLGLPDGHQEGPGVACSQGTCIFCNCCGDGIVAFNEQCDDGNINNGDGCSATCQLENLCGNGVQNGGEVCDDGNQIPNDGCENDCTLSSFCPPSAPTPTPTPCAGQFASCNVLPCCVGFTCIEGQCF